MIQVNEIISTVQDAINDLAGERVTHAAYIDMLNAVGRNIARETQVWINRYMNIPVPQVQALQADYYYVVENIVLYNGNYYVCVRNHASLPNLPMEIVSGDWVQITLWAVGTPYVVNQYVWFTGPNFFKCQIAHTSTMNDMPPNSVYWGTFSSASLQNYIVQLPYVVSGNDISPYKILRVVRGNPSLEIFAWQECREYSSQAIGRTISGNHSFDINRTQLGKGDFLIQQVDANGNVDGSLYFIFAEPFDINEQIYIDYISGRPFSDNPLNMWDPNAILPVLIPDEMSEAFEWGLKWKVYQKLYDGGDESYRNRAQSALQLYQTNVLQAAAYARMFKDNQSIIRIQPMNWLSED